MSKVVHCLTSPYDIYIGRGRCPRTGTVGKWGNPFEIGKDGTRKEVIEKYRKWLPTQPELMTSLHELRGKVLGCWCHPKACHGEVLIEFANANSLFGD